ncbi:hypothetical protein T12_7544 [Trichinella patagoniensis]|uniref:CCHC-type domain-containing protein n=1 Tax=Trichinella patagoniensis TaxID=990121 RepID=A0A0V0Z6S6_9BILA|nr:hypothetical protein T12_7544 [Trichinella patagoniensis]
MLPTKRELGKRGGRAVRHRLDRFLTELEELNIDAVDGNLLGGQLELTETLFRETDSLQAEWEQDLDPRERNAAIENWAKSRRLFLEARARAQGRLRPKQENGPSRCDGCHSGNFRQTADPVRIGKLPELTLPLFDGEVLEFPTFWAQFEAGVHANTELDDATKFAYLLSNTTGRALGAIFGIPKRFGQPKIVARAHFLALWKAPECREMTRQGIQTLVDEITKQLRCLAAMGKDPHAGELPLSEALVPGLKEKFPRKLQKAWDLKVGSGPESEDNLEKFLEFAQLQAESLSPPDEFSPEASRQGKSGEATRKDSKSAKRKGRDRVTSSAAALVTSVQRVCPFCEGDHDAACCQRFLDAEYSARTSMSREKGVCYKCLKTGHRARECRTRRPCGVDRCRQPHHQLLHPPATGGRRTPPEPSGRSKHSRGVSPDRPRSRIRAGWKPRGGKLPLRHGGGSLLHPEGRRRGPRAHGISRALSFHDPGRSSGADAGKHPGAGACDPAGLWQGPVSAGRALRRGSDITRDGTAAWSAAVDRWLHRHRLLLRICDGSNQKNDQRNRGGGNPPRMSRLREDGPSSFLKSPAPPEDTDEDRTAEMKKLEEELRLDDGRYSVSLPWVPGLPNNYSQTRRRLLALGRRLGTHEDDHVRYASVMKQYLDEGWAEPAPATSPPRRTWYLPHHAVYQGVGDERKCRVVFDGAAKYNGTTLNSQLEAGPNLQIDLFRDILSFRRLCVGLQADIEKMYLQIRVRPEDRDVCRFLWWDDEQKIRSYRLTRVCFGLTCTPFLAMGTVRSHVRRHQASAPRATEEVLNNMYMDDLATSCDSVAEARSLTDQLGSLLASGGFWLHKWANNEPDALRELPVEKAAMGVGGRPWKTLAIYWQHDDDHLTFVAPEGTRLAAGDTKRQMLSTASGIFDPIGCLAPFLVLARILFHSLWETGADWDEPLQEEENRPWIDWKRELDDLPLVRFPRALVSVPLDQAKQIELHAFCDASERAYGAVVYLRMETASGATRINLVAAKTRVSPVKRLSLPRLELMGALTAARLIRFAQRALQLDVRSLFCWSDSEVTLPWVRSAASRWKPFVRNRVKEIQRLVEPACWRHCPGKNNPADLLSRGSSLKGLTSNYRWWQGPRWLAGPAEGWPRKRGPSEHNSLLPIEEARAHPPKGALLVSVVTHAQDDVLHPGRYGDIERLFRITALCLRFVRNCGSATGERRSGPLTVQELDAAEQTWVRIAQRQGFRKEIDELRTSGDVAARSHLRPLSPFLDEAGTLRVGGRLEKSNLPLTEKHPAILPNEHEMTRGLILRCHLRQLHAGVSQTLATLRQRYWVLQGRSRVRHIIRGCLQCRWATARPTQPRMAALPEVRTTLAPAFVHVVMDFAGPLFVKTTRKTTSPRYITCMVSRAVHLELVPEMSTVGVMQALRCFIARRGRPATIQTDNFRSFQSAASELRRLWRGIDVDQVQNELAGQRIQWHFIPPRAPWIGGYLERLIRTMKEPLGKCWGRLCWTTKSSEPSSTGGTRAPQSIPATNGPHIYGLSRSRQPRNELAYTRGGAQAVGEPVAVPAAADRQMLATLEKRLPLHVAPAQEMDEQYRGSEAERPRPDPGRQRPAGAMPPQGGGETFSRWRRRGPRSAALDLHGGDDQVRRQTGGAGISAR